MAYRLIAHGVQKGDRIALIAETGPYFAALFCGAIYAGAWPVPLPLPTSFGGKENYIDQIAVQMASAEPKLLLFPTELRRNGQVRRRASGLRGRCLGKRSGRKMRPRSSCRPRPQTDICFLQYSSGSTRFPHGVAVTHRSLLANLAVMAMV
jgi:fatty-acyl-CoA synthase